MEFVLQIPVIALTMRSGAMRTRSIEVGMMSCRFGKFILSTEFLFFYEDKGQKLIANYKTTSQRLYEMVVWVYEMLIRSSYLFNKVTTSFLI